MALHRAVKGVIGALVTASAGGVLSYSILNPPQLTPPPAIDGPALADAAGPNVASALDERLPEPETHYREIVERPLFLDTRRPPPPEPEEPEVAVPEPPPPEEPDPPQLTLLGIMRLNGNTWMLVEDRAKGETRRLRPGSSVDGWRLGEPEGDKVALTRAGVGAETLTLQRSFQRQGSPRAQERVEAPVEAASDKAARLSERQRERLRQVRQAAAQRRAALRERRRRELQNR